MGVSLCIGFRTLIPDYQLHRYCLWMQAGEVHIFKSFEFSIQALSAMTIVY